MLYQSHIILPYRHNYYIIIKLKKYDNYNKIMIIYPVNEISGNIA